MPDCVIITSQGHRTIHVLAQIEKWGILESRQEHAGISSALCSPRCSPGKGKALLFSNKAAGDFTWNYWSTFINMIMLIICQSSSFPLPGLPPQRWNIACIHLRSYSKCWDVIIPHLALIKGERRFLGMVEERHNGSHRLGRKKKKANELKWSLQTIMVPLTS